tara:strand:- start:1879 stop:2304 length:426 start_codon:yes stop_codon:yes gene_type:complete
MITVSNFKSVEVLRNLFSSALTRFENLTENSEYFTNSNLSLYKVAIEWANTFNHLGFFTEVDDVLYYLEKPYKWQQELYLIDALHLNRVFEQDYTDWFKDNDTPKECEQDVQEVMEYILNNNFNIYSLEDILDDLEDDFRV